MQFGANQAIIVAPTAERDAQRVAALSTLNRMGGAESAASVLPRVAEQAAEALARGAGPLVTLPHCPACQAEVQPGARFCMHCGQALSTG